MKPTWEREGIQLYLGDCRDVLPYIGEIDCTVTSPPYNQLGNVDADSLSGIWAIRGESGKAKGQFVNNGYHDDLDESEYQQQQNDLFAEIGARTKQTGSLFYNHQVRWRDGNMLHPVDWFEPLGWRARQEIVWDRGGGMMFNARMFCRFDERIQWFVKGKHKWNQNAVGWGTIWRIAREQNKEHPVAFPIEIPMRCIAAATDIGDVVFDPYMGSATTGAACVVSNRRFIGVEREPKYFNIAKQRIIDELDRAPLFKEPSQTQVEMFE